MNIYAKLTLLCLFLVLFTAGVLSFFADNKVEETLKEEVVASISQQAKGISSDIGRFMFSRQNDLKMASKNPYFTASDISQDQLVDRLLELEKINDLYYSFAFYGIDRYKVADSKRLGIGKVHPNTSYWLPLGAGKSEAVDVSKSETGRVVMHFASKVNDDFDNPVGVLVGSISVNELFKVVGEYSLSDDSTRNLDIHLINNEGTILYSNTDPSSILNATYQDFGLVSQVNDPGVNFLETDESLYFVTTETGYSSFTGNDWKLILSIPKDRAKCSSKPD